MVRVLQFADIVNRDDFIDTIVRHADPERFQLGVCARSERSNIAKPVYEAQTPWWILGGVSRLALPQSVWQLAALLRQWKADILHTHHYDQAIIGWLATRIVPKTRLVVGRHYSDAIYRLSSEVKRRTLLSLEQRVNRAAARIVAPSRYIQEILTQRQGISQNKIDVIPYGFVPEKYEVPSPDEIQRLRAELGLDGRFVIGNFSRLHEEKGHRFLLEAVAQLRGCLPHLTLLVVGAGPERSSLERQIRSSNLQQVVRLVGWRRDAMTLMASVDAVVQPTLQEAFSQVMVEALWMRKPLVITDVSGATDIIHDGHNGLLVPKGNAAAIAVAIGRLARDAHLRERLGAAGRRYVEEHLTIEKVIHCYEYSYLQALES
jgi:glycosyltransferase involved in cell wall biosynthesis